MTKLLDAMKFKMFGWSHFRISVQNVNMAANGSMNYGVSPVPQTCKSRFLAHIRVESRRCSHMVCDCVYIETRPEALDAPLVKCIAYG